MSDEITKLKADLAELNAKCLTARDNEIRYALQRSRLEAERSQLLVNLVEAATSTPEPAPVPAPAAPWRVTVQQGPATATPPSAPTNLDTLVKASKNYARKHKPDGLPTIEAMITAAFQEIPSARPPDVADYIRKRWGWPELKTPTISSKIWHMRQEGRLNGVGQH